MDTLQSTTASPNRRNPKRPHSCPVCGIVFWDYSSKGRKYCSIQCKGKGITATRTITRQCEVCAAVFTAKASRLKNAEVRFCSRRCYQTGASQAVNRGKMGCRDHNESEIVAWLILYGIRVRKLSPFKYGRGAPDLLACRGRRFVYIEIKNKQAKLTGDQVRYHEALQRRGKRVAVVYNARQAIDAIEEATDDIQD